MEHAQNSKPCEPNLVRLDLVTMLFRSFYIKQRNSGSQQQPFHKKIDRKAF